MKIQTEKVQKLGTYEVRCGEEVKKFKVYKSGQTYYTKPVKDTKNASN